MFTAFLGMKFEFEIVSFQYLGVTTEFEFEKLG